MHGIHSRPTTAIVSDAPDTTHTPYITDHPFTPRGEWWSRCKCGLSEAAHSTTVRGQMLTTENDATESMKHAWRCLGGAGGWEVWECTRCRVTRIPNIFGGLWRWRLWLNRCKRRRVELTPVTDDTEATDSERG